MDVSLSDLLVCPRCGPTYGLILLPYDATDRRVRSGMLGCANCRERWPIEAGVADLRPHRGAGPGGEPVPSRAAPGDSDGPGGSGSGIEASARAASGEDAAIRLAGLMNLAEARGTVLVAGPEAIQAAALAALVEGVEVVAASDAPPSGPGVSGMRLGGVLPFRTGSLRGVALTGMFAGLLEEGGRVLGRDGHLVLDPAPSRTRERLVAAGLRVLVEEGSVVVAAGRP